MPACHTDAPFRDDALRQSIIEETIDVATKIIIPRFRKEGYLIPQALRKGFDFGAWSDELDPEGAESCGYNHISETERDIFNQLLGRILPQDFFPSVRDDFVSFFVRDSDQASSANESILTRLDMTLDRIINHERRRESISSEAEKILFSSHSIEESRDKEELLALLFVPHGLPELKKFMTYLPERDNGESLAQAVERSFSRDQQALLKYAAWFHGVPTDLSAVEKMIESYDLKSLQRELSTTDFLPASLLERRDTDLCLLDLDLNDPSSLYPLYAFSDIVDRKGGDMHAKNAFFKKFVTNNYRVQPNLDEQAFKEIEDVVSFNRTLLHDYFTKLYDHFVRGPTDSLAELSSEGYEKLVNGFFEGKAEMLYTEREQARAIVRKDDLVLDDPRRQVLYREAAKQLREAILDAGGFIRSYLFMSQQAKDAVKKEPVDLAMSEGLPLYLRFERFWRAIPEPIAQDIYKRVRDISFQQ